MLEAEDSDDEEPPEITDEDMERVERQGLCREENLYLFEAWYQLGGLQHPPALQELAEMPADMVKDLGYILGTLGRLRRERKALKGLNEK